MAKQPTKRKPAKPKAPRRMATATVHYTNSKGLKNHWSFGICLPDDDAKARREHAEKWLPKGCTIKSIKVTK